MMKKIIFLVGTRPEVIKIAPLLRVCKKRKGFQTLFCTSGQHDALLRDTLAALNCPPDLSFAVHGDLTAKTSECMCRFDEILTKEAPDAALVHGDTLTAFAGAIAAFHRRIPVFHVEAGLRTNTAFSPFPEELYRRAIDHLSTLHFAPTQRAKERLLAEGIPREGIYTVGNTAIDGLFCDVDARFTHPLLESGKKLILLTLHRRESTEVFQDILTGVAQALSVRDDVSLFFPMHPNPSLRRAVNGTLSGVSGVTLSEPVAPELFHNMLSRSALVLTDSGGVSEEATALGVPTLLLREETERTEGIDAGVLHLIGRHPDAIANAITDFLNFPRACKPSFVFGDGKTSERIANIIERYFT